MLQAWKYKTYLHLPLWCVFWLSESAFMSATIRRSKRVVKMLLSTATVLLSGDNTIIPFKYQYLVVLTLLDRQRCWQVPLLRCWIHSNTDRAWKGTNAASALLTEIKNTMSDRYMVEKTLTLLEEYRSSIHSDVVQSWNALPFEEQQNMSTLNNFAVGCMS